MTGTRVYFEQSKFVDESGTEQRDLHLIDLSVLVIFPVFYVETV